MTSFRTLSFPLMGGTDTKIAGEVLPAPKLQTAQNVWSSETGSLQRRYGHTALASTDQDGATVTGWLATATYQDRLLGFTSTKLYEYTAGDARWTTKGRATSWRETTNPITVPSASSPTASIGNNCADVAVIGNWRLYAYDLFETNGANTQSSTCVTLVDLNGAHYTTDFQLGASFAGALRSSGVRVIAHGARFYVIYSPVSSTTTLSVFIIDTTSPATIASSLAGAAVVIDATMIAGVFDAEENTTYGPFVAYADAAGSFSIKFGFLSTAGVLGSTSTTSTGAVDAIRIAVDVATGNAMHGVVYLTGNTVADVFACLRSWSGAAWTATATSAAIDGPAGSVTGHVVCKWDPASATKLRIFYDNLVNVTARCVRHATYTTAGVSDPSQPRVPISFVASKPFIVGSTMCLWVANSGPQATAFLMYVDSTGDVLLQGVANQAIHVSNITGARQVPRVAKSGSTTYYWPSFTFVRKAFPAFIARKFPGGHIYGYDHAGDVIGMREVVIETSDVSSHVCVEDGASLLVPSTLLTYFDGVSIVEAGFMVYVNNLTGFADSTAATPSAGAGLLAGSSDYYYRIVPEWTNANGEREQGTDTGPLKVTTGVGDNTVTLAIATIPWTLKQPFNAGGSHVARHALSFAVYRTTANPASGDDAHYRVGAVKNVTSSDTVSFVDLVSDTVAATKEQLYADTELSNLGPAPGFILASGNGRVLVSGLPDDPSLIIYSKTRSHGVPLSFNSVLQIQIPVDAGDVTSMAVLDEQIVAFTSDRAYRVVGDGLNNTGGGAGYAPPVSVLAAEDGAINHRATGITAAGLVYQSQRGMMLFDSSLQGVYIGAALEGLGTQGYATGIVNDPARRLFHVTFSTTTAVYDYQHQQWYTWSNWSDGPPCLWGGQVVIVQDDAVQYSDATAWKDGNREYAVTLKLGWEHPAGLLGNMAWRRVGIVGRALDTHYLDIQIARDYDATTTQTIDETILSASVLRRRHRIAHQKANAIQVTIRDAVLDRYGLDTVLSTAGFRLFSVELEVGVRSPRPSGRGTDTPASGGSQ